jgi:hypothetical protein
MGTSIKGVYRNGRIELQEVPTNVHDDADVIVTFVEPGAVDLRARGMTPDKASELRARLATFGEEWDSPEMDVYDDYDAVLAERSAR